MKQLNAAVKSAPPLAAGPPQLQTRPLQTADEPQVQAILKALDLDYPCRSLPHFWVAIKNRQLVAVAELKEIAAGYLLSCVGTHPAWQGQGIGSAFLRTLLSAVRPDVYLYTVIPQFYQRLGFELCQRPAGVPDIGTYYSPELTSPPYICMVRRGRDA